MGAVMDVLGAVKREIEFLREWFSDPEINEVLQDHFKDPDYRVLSNYQVPWIPIESVERGKEIHVSVDTEDVVKSMIFEARANDALPQSIVLKEYFELNRFLQSEQDRPLLGKRALHFMMREINGFRDHPNLELPLAVVYDRKSDRIAVPLLRHEGLNLHEYAHVLYQLTSGENAPLRKEEYVGRMLDAAKVYAGAVAHVHRMGFKHGDATLENVGLVGALDDVIEWNGTFKLRDFDWVGLQHWFPRIAKSYTTQLREQDLVWGRHGYLPPELVRGTRDPRSIKYDLDTYAIGKGLGALLFPDEFTTLSQRSEKRIMRSLGPETDLIQLDRFKRHDMSDLPQQHAMRYVIARALALERSYPKLDDLVEHIEAVKRGDYRAVINDAGNIRTWRYSNIEEERIAEDMKNQQGLTRRKVLYGISAAALGGGWLLINQMESNDDLRNRETAEAVRMQREARMRAWSPEMLAREIARTNFSADAFEKFRNILRNIDRRSWHEIYLPRIKSNQTAKLPKYSVAHQGGKAFYSTGQDTHVEHYLATCLDELSEDGFYIEPIITLLPHITLDISGDTRDTRQPSNGRYATLLELLPSLSDKYPEHRKVLDEALHTTLNAAAIAPHQYTPPGIYAGISENEWRPVKYISTRRAHLMTPFICAIAGSEYRDLILNPSKLRMVPRNAVDEFVRRLPPVMLYELLDGLAVSTLNLSYLVGENGEVFPRANVVGERMVVVTETNDPGAKDQKERQPIIAQEEARLLLATAYALNTLEGIFVNESDATHRILRAELGTRYRGYVHEKIRQISAMQSTEQLVNEHYRKHRNATLLAPEYLRIHQDFGQQGLPRDAMADARYAAARELRGSPDAYETIRAMCAHHGFAQSSDSPHFDDGLLYESRLYQPEVRGTSVECDGYFRRTLYRTKERKLLA